MATPAKCLFPAIFDIYILSLRTQTFQMKKLHHLLLGVMCLASISAWAQPTVFYTNLTSTTSPALTNSRLSLTDMGAFRQCRFQTTAAPAPATQTYAFHIGSPVAPNYDANWRPYTVGDATGVAYALNTVVIPGTTANSARYNSFGGGVDGNLSALATSTFYTVNIQENSGTDNLSAIWSTTFNPATFSGISQLPANGSVTPGSVVTVSITSSVALGVGENVFVRYSTNGYLTSGVAQASFTGTTGTAFIPGFNAGTAVSYYIFSSNRSLAQLNTIVGTSGIGQAGYDMATLNLENNAGVNYTYTVNAGASPVTVNASAGTLTADYGDLRQAFDAINAGQHSGSITILINANTTETVPAVLFASGTGLANYTSVTVNPAGGGARTISGAIAAGSPLIDLNGADNVTVDGLNTGGNSLTISNTTVSNTSGTSTIRFIGGATSNTVTRCTVLGAFTGTVATNGANIFFSTDANTTNGNDNNTISNCNIGPAGSTNNTKGILGNGSTSTTAIGNSGIVIDNNNIYDYFGAAVTSAGIAVNGGCNGWTITNNRFYQTAIRTWTTGANHRAIELNSTTATSGVQGMTVTGNIIGYASSSQTGVYALTGSTGRFTGILFNGINAGTLSTINNNTVASVSLTGVTSSGTSTNSPLIGIVVLNGLATTNGNTIGSQVANGSIVLSTNTTSPTDVYGIYNFSLDNWTSNNNNVGGISVTNAGGSGTFIIYGMRANTGTTLSWTATGNNVGGTVANSIQLTATGNASQVIGMHTSNAPASFTGNTIRNLTNNIGTGTTTTASVIGINITTATPIHTVSQNTIHNLSNTNTTQANIVTGIQFTGGNGNVVQRNLIYDLSVATNSATAEVNGIRVGGGTTVYRNNKIRLGAGILNAIGAPALNGGTSGVVGINEALGTNSFWHNSVYIEGAPTAGTGSSYAFNGVQTVNTRSFRNNIFVNARSNNGASGKHFAIKINGTAANPAGLTINNNVYFVNGTGGVFGFFNSADVANLAAWQAAVGQDAGSFESNPQFVAPSAAIPDLHISSTLITVVEGNGFDLGVVDDFDGETRSGLTPVDIGADAGNFIGVDLAPPTITYTPLGNTISTSNRTLSTTITDLLSGVPTSGIGLPVIYFRKGTSGAFASTQAMSAGGGTYNFTIDYSLVAGGSVVLGDLIQYYVVAQDGAATPNVSANPFAGASGFTANPPAAGTAPTSPNSYLVTAPIAGTFSVPGSYPSLTNTGGIFEAINNGVLTGNINIEITADLLTETGAVALRQLSEDPTGSNFNLRIYPTGAARTISGSFNGALIRLNGASRVTIDGSIGGTGTDRSLTITNTSVTSPAVVAFSSVGTLPITNGVLRNCIIINGVNTSSAVVISDATTLGSPGIFSNITIQNNDIQRAFVGVFANGGTTSSSNGANLIYTQNTLNSSGANAIRNVGLYMQGVNGATVTNNLLANFDRTNAENDAGIWLASGTTQATVSNNTVTGLGSTAAGGNGPTGILVSPGIATSNVDISDNNISDISTNGNAAGSLARGIAVTAATGGVTIQRNNVQNVFNAALGTFPAIGIDLLGGNNITLRNNFISNITGDMSGGTAFSTDFGIFGIRVGSGTGHRIYHNSVNLYGLRTGTPSSSLLTAALGISNTSSTDLDVRNNIFANNITGGTTGIANVSVYLPAGATSAMNLTWNNNQYYHGSNVSNAGPGQAGITSGTNFFTTLPALTAYTSTLSAAGTNDNASSAFTTAVPFVSATDLRLLPQTGCTTTGKGATLATVTDDIDRNSRNTLPFIGAHEAYEPASSSTTLAGIATAAGANPAIRTFLVNGPTDYLLNCNLIATITPSGASPVSGQITSSVSVDTGASKLGTATLYLARNMDITPVNNPNTSTATLKLYFLQSEFDNYNTKAPSNGFSLLPTGPADAVGISNLILRQFYGNQISRNPLAYNGGGSVDFNTEVAGVTVVWNATNNWWEVTIPVSQFSGFFVTSKPSAPLPVRLEYFRGTKAGNTHALNWKLTPINTSRATMMLEHSADGRNFSVLMSRTVTDLDMQQPFSYANNQLFRGINYYRLKMIDAQGKITYSGIVALMHEVNGVELMSLANNPVLNGQCKLFATSGKNNRITIQVTDMSGRIVTQKVFNLIAGFNTLELNVQQLAAGSYQVMGITEDGRTRVLRFVK